MSHNYWKILNAKSTKNHQGVGFVFFLLTIYPLHPVDSHRWTLAGGRQKSASDPVTLGEEGKRLLRLNRGLALSFVRPAQLPRAMGSLLAPLHSPVLLGRQPRARRRPDAAREHPAAASPGSIPHPTPRVTLQPGIMQGLVPRWGGERGARRFQSRIYYVSPRPLRTLWWFISAGKSQENTPNWTVLLTLTFKQLHSQGWIFPLSLPVFFMIVC